MAEATDVWTRTLADNNVAVVVNGDEGMEISVKSPGGEVLAGSKYDYKNVDEVVGWFKAVGGVTDADTPAIAHVVGHAFIACDMSLADAAATAPGAFGVSAGGRLRSSDGE